MSSTTDPQAGGPANEDQLTGWKEIAAYLGKSVRTVQRWERQSGLPVHRVQPLGEVVFAFRSELDAWRNTPIAAESDDASDAGEIPVELPPLAADGEARGHAPGPSVEVPIPAPPGLRRPPRAVYLLIIGAVLILTLAGFAFFRPPNGSMITVVSPLEPQVQGQHFKVVVQGARPGATLHRWTRVPNGQEETMSTPVQADGDGTMQWGFSTDCRTETGTHHLWTEDPATGVRSARTALVVLANPACESTQPDLAARVDRLDRTSVKAGEAVTVSFTIWNMGTADAVPTQTRIRLGRQSTRTGIGDPGLTDVATPGLSVGGSNSLVASVSIPSDAAPGVYYLWIVADNGSATVEPNSFNNFARSQAIIITPRSGG